MKTKLLFLLLLATQAIAQTTNEARQYLVKWEGYKNTPYKCPSGNLTVGIGHKLQPKEVKSSYTQIEIEQFFIHDLAIAKEAAYKYIPNFDSHSREVKLVILSIIFTVGPKGIQSFNNLIIALSYKSYGSAALELADSKWYNQVSANRANHHYRVLKNAN